MKNALLLYNPAAGRFPPSRRRLSKLAEKLLVMGISTELEPTRTGLAPDELALDGKDVLIIYGGDGTVHDVIPAVLNSGVKLAVLPAGTANVLAKELGIPRDPERALRLLSAGKTAGIRVGEARMPGNGGPAGYFHLMAGVGLDAYVISRTNLRLKRTLGWASYWWAGFRSFRAAPLVPFEVVVDGVPYRATFAVVSNCRYYGGQLLMAPRADVREAALDVCLFTSSDRWRLPAYLAGALGGRHVGLSDVRYLKASRVEVEGDPAIPFQMDGDIVSHLPVEFSVCDQVVEIFVP